MSLDAFLYELHFDTDKTKPVEWEPDWQNAPLTYKLYRHLPSFPLCPEVPLTLDGRGATAYPDLRRIGHFLWYVYGLTRVSHSVFTWNAAEPFTGSVQQLRRFAPSGGGLYPSELYVYLKLDDLPAGLYHYDAAHHRLVLLRPGRFDSYLEQATGYVCEGPGCFGAAFVSTMFWKNFFKYYNFSYRLQGLDAGAVLGQLLAAADRFGFDAKPVYLFLDRAINHFLGLHDGEESVYAVVPLSAAPSRFPSFRSASRNRATSFELCGSLPMLRHERFIRSGSITPHPMLTRINEASMLDTLPPVPQAGEAGPQPNERLGPSVFLPRADRSSYDLAAACRLRHSPEHEFIPGQVTLLQLAFLLQQAGASMAHRNDVNQTNSRSPVSLYVCVHSVHDLADGAYRYNPSSHSLSLIRPGDQRRRLQQASTSHNISMLQIPLCLHIIGDTDHLIPAFGYRGYRIQQMQAGILVQHILLAAAALGLGARPLLGYDSLLCDDIYRLAPEGKTCLIQIPVGPYRQRLRLEGGLHG